MRDNSSASANDIVGGYVKVSRRQIPYNKIAQARAGLWANVLIAMLREFDEALTCY